MNKLIILILTISSMNAFAQKLDTLTVEKIMRDPKWIGVSPSNIHWSDDSRKVYFDWNPENKDRDELFSASPANYNPVKVSVEEKKALVPERGEWNKKRTLKVYEKDGDIFLEETKTGKISQLTYTTDRETNPAFSGDESRVIFKRGDNLFALKLSGGELMQLTNFIKTTPGAASTQPAARRGNRNNQSATNEQERWLKNQQLELFDIIKEKDKDRKLDSIDRKENEQKKIKELPIDDKLVSYLELSPDCRYVTYRLIKSPEGAKTAIVPDYVTVSGFTEDIINRTKVGAPQSTFEFFIFDTQRDTVYKIITKDIPGIKDLPDYVKDYPKELA
ncbi:MAG TPA: hypothetical protein VGI43_20120, partial [Mucilaginibacter sp.]